MKSTIFNNWPNKITSLTFVTILVFLSSCVTQKKFTELQSKYDAMSIDKNECEANYNALKQHTCE